MKILALELSSAQGSIAWLDDHRAPFAVSFSNDRKHSGLFFENLQSCSRQFGAPELIVVGIGPGSYAGVRIAIAAAIGLRAASAAKLIGLSSICALDTGINEYYAIGDARRHSFYFARVSAGKLLEGPSLYTVAELVAKIADPQIPVYASETLGQFPRAIVAFPSARRLGELARGQADEINDSQLLEPIYLREPHITTPKASRASTIIS
ncbi:MAG: tRNA threonylcarbamoyladenosine biosynthesis protein TsaB [Verrucomicrobiota bacterium]|jgi:tRNA threonylcarbamoyl adenosine modification protein YeaZ